ncbi:diguanylate cyclase [Pseudodesulfovibrio sediminis]|uniref:Diguanylate cyclase n=1 Tax=Pseudodesulfovibrio sediminis TaxID=2810563 RepID=A0ABN6EZ71_9BACT|nr:diguanylate cyclase [Pseudodesulfovibrio sediminis]BCS90088.1 hypothetical protein PSDVSF_33300 [Pseudodesulfovibrio sediminis]
MTLPAKDTFQAIPPQRLLVVKYMVRILIPLTLTTILFMSIYSVQTQRAFKEEIDADVEAYATSISRVLDNLMWNFQTEELVSALATISSNPSMRGAELFDDQGKLFLSYGDNKGEAGETLLSVSKDIFKRQPYGERIDIGKLVIHYSYANAMSKHEKRMFNQIIRMLIIILVMCISGYYAFHYTIGRPLKELLKAIHTTDSSSSKWHEAKWESDDEIGQVIEAHNAMIRHIGAKDTALSESEKRYRELFDNAQVGIFHSNPDGSILNANLTLAHLMAYNSREEILKANVLDHYYDPDDSIAIKKLLAKDGQIAHYRVQFNKVDGTTIWVELSGNLKEDGSVNGILQDVTTTVEAQTALEERDELHRAFFEENKAVMLLHDPLDSSIQFVNPAACNYYGYSERELTSMTIYDLNNMSDEEIFEELKNSTAERRNYFNHTHTLKNGTKRHVEVYTGPISLGKRHLHYSIIHDVTEKRRLEGKLERMATRDQLTGAFNRHAFFLRAKEEIIRAQRFNHPMTVLMFDLDHFKAVNDTHGHAVGDEVLRVFAMRCRADLRQSDIFARLGGEEFAALLIETDESRGVEIAERIRAIAADKPIATESGELTITTSIGITALQDEDTVTTMLKRADKALYQAKTSGRNTLGRI